MSDAKSNGQRVLEAWESWISSWVAFPAEPGGQALVLALWAMSTWFCSRLPATGYLFVTSEGPGCGKSTLLKALGALSLRGRQRSTMRTMAVVRDIEEHKGAVTYFFDQVEALTSTRITDDLAILLTGYEMGGKHGISVGQKQVEFDTYCPKAFAASGSIFVDLTTRCLVCHLGYGSPARSWTDEVMVRDAEAAELLQAFGQVLPLASAVKWVPFLAVKSGRDRQVTSPAWSVANALNLDDATMARLEAALVSWIDWKDTKGAGRAAYRDMLGNTPIAAAAAKDVRRDLERQALADLAAVLPVTGGKVTGHIASVRAVELMAEHNRAWIRFGGMGLDAMALAALVKPFGLEPEPVRLTKGAGKQVKGYRADKVLAALGKLTPTV